MIMSNDEDRRIRQMFESANQAFAGGQAQAAERMLQQAEAEAPAHPLVQNMVAGRMLRAGNLMGAKALLEQAVGGDPANPMLWLNLAGALRGLGDADAEMAALDKLLKIEPLHVRALLQKASLLEIRKDSRAAAASYRTALRIIPEGFEPPPQMRAILQHAKEAVEANDRALEVFVEERLQGLRERYADQPLDRFDGCLATLLRKRRIFAQQPTFMYFPRLAPIEFYDRKDFPWLDSIEAATDDIREELLNVLSDGPEVLSPYVSHPEGTAGRFRNSTIHADGASIILWREGVRGQGQSGALPANGRRARGMAAMRRSGLFAIGGIFHTRRKDADPAAFGREQHAPARASAADRPARLRFSRRRRGARMGSGEGLRVRRYDGARSVERQRCSARSDDLRHLESVA